MPSSAIAKTLMRLGRGETFSNASSTLRAGAAIVQPSVLGRAVLDHAIFPKQQRAYGLIRRSALHSIHTSTSTTSTQCRGYHASSGDDIDDAGDRQCASAEETEEWDNALFMDREGQRALKSRNKASLRAIVETPAPSIQDAATTGSSAVAPCEANHQPSAQASSQLDSMAMDNELRVPGLSSSSHSQNEKVEPDGKPFMMFNVFSHRIVRSNSPSVTNLALLGIYPDANTRLLALQRPDILCRFADQLQRREIGPPRQWSSGLLHRIVTHLSALTPPSPSTVQRATTEGGNLAQHDDTDNTTQPPPVEYISQLLQSLHSQLRSRVGGVDNNGKFTFGSRRVVSNVVSLHGEGADPAATQSAPSLEMHNLTDEQRSVLELATQGYHMYIGGGAGTGKTSLLRCLKLALHEMGLRVATTATTGIAAVNIQGSTLHGRFKVNRKLEVKANAAELKAYDVIIIDEVSILPQPLFENLDCALRKANGCDLPFGGVQMILCGDFMQLSAIADRPIVGCELFRRNFVMVKLQQLIRQQMHSVFAKQLDEMRRGVAPHDIADTVTMLPPGSFVEDAINLLPTNSEVVVANNKQLARLEGAVVEFPPLLQPPELQGDWSATYVVSVPKEVDKFSAKALIEAIEHHLFRAPGAVSLLMLVNSLGAALASTTMERLASGGGPVSSASSDARRALCVYPLFEDAYAVRVQFPSELSREDVSLIQKQLDTLSDGIAHVNNGAHRVVDTFESGTGLHTPNDEKQLEHFAKISPVGSPLHLKLGCRVLVRTNLSSTIVNGSVGTVVGFAECEESSFSRYLVTGKEALIASYADFLKAEMGQVKACVPIVDFGNGIVEAIPPRRFEVGGFSSTNHYSSSIIAIPLTLAYAFTVHKVQGLTLLGRVHLELSKMWPCDHLLYVAMSRVRNPEQLSVSGYENRLVRAAADCLIFDESIPAVAQAEVPSYLIPNTWKLHPTKRKAALCMQQARRQHRKLESKPTAAQQQLEQSGGLAK